MKHITQIIILAITLSLFANGCISLKTEYPAINYYQLKQEQTLIESNVKLDGVLQIRDFTVSAEYDTEHILAIWGNVRVQKYYYHRWITGISDMFTDFLVTRFNRAGSFTGSVVKSGAISPPDYILEGQILEMKAINSETQGAGDNSCILTVKISLLKRDKMRTERDLILTNTYTERTDRRNNHAASIPDAFSKCFSTIADMILVDIQKAIGKSK